ncbi:Binding-protein-dependent transport system inner membrane component [Bhargavaea ginsengi]|uniref:Binding-protein-dependent transport system inner membrane component n=1 Tax=Bhargavaea ginsengi TaxID=426757 RepID=A0A1H7B9N9_9BACL|nr:ABC transporter permease subunit [Bhargavaea ginsengi]SEJ74461.1 Binding-protein-dependent transport system inner membrane component [Bhargavaea ginsengi]
MIKTISLRTAVWLFSFVILVLLLLIPMDTVFEEGRGGSFMGATYDYQIQNHVANIQSFFTYIYETGGLGTDEAGRPIMDQVTSVFLRSMLIFMPAILIGFFVGIAKGIFDFNVRKTQAKFIGQPATIGFLSVPDIAIIIFIQLMVLLLQSYGLVEIDLFGHDKIDNVLMNILYLSIYPVMFIANITFKTLETEQGLDYIRTARSKGTGELKILYRHMLKNGLPKILAYSNTMVLYTLSNLFIVEVFTEYRGAAFYMYHTLGSSTNFYVGALVSPNIISQIGYIFMFTLVILAFNIVSGVARSAISPLEDER